MAAASATKTLPQWGRACERRERGLELDEERAGPPSGSGFQVKWMAIVSCPYCGLIHRRSAATVRISRHLQQRPDPVGEGAARPGCAATACARGTRYSDWSSSPLLGVKPMRKCGSRSDHGPGTPSWGVQLTGSSPRIGCRSTVAAPRRTARRGPARGIRDPALDPDLVDRLAPAGEHADAVAGGGDLVEVLVAARPMRAPRTPAGGPRRQARRPG